MLRNLYVKNLALIQEISIDFTKGLNILTGETGAGKSILIDSVMLALGGRYTADILRTGADYGYVELSFELDDPAVETALQEMDVFPEGHQLVLARRMMAGKSISKINGETVTMGLLRRVASMLIDVHGQRDAQTLLESRGHRDLLDTYGGMQILQQKERVIEAYRNGHQTELEITALGGDETDRKRELDLLLYEVKELEQANLKVGEDEELESTYEKMYHGRRIMDSVQEAYGCLDGEDASSAASQVGRALRSLSESLRYDSHLEELFGELKEIEGMLSDFSRGLADYQRESAFSEEDFQWTQERLNEINHLKQKYGNTVEDVLGELEKKKGRIRALEDYEGALSRLQEKLTQEQEHYRKEAKQLTGMRQKSAQEFEREVSGHLRELNFEEAGFQVEIDQRTAFSPDGQDSVAFLISLNPGEPMKLLTDVASGGELSRIMLAIRTAMAEKGSGQTIIFDEIDSGISGRTAQKVAEKMARISREHQVICITHLSQIAAMADAHYLIEKQVRREKEQVMTTTGIQRLNREQIIEELARISGGVNITETARSNAMEMKQQADELKKNA